MKSIILIVCILLHLFVFSEAQTLPPNLSQSFDIGNQNYALWWYGAIVNAIRINGSQPGNGGPVIATRVIAILSVAIHDTVNAFNPIYEFYAATNAPPVGADIDAAIAGAGYQSLVLLYPNRIPDWTLIYRTQLALLKRLNTGIAHTDIRSGFQFGRSVGLGIYNLRLNDGSAQDLFVPFTFTFAPGTFVPSAPLFINPPIGGRWGFVTPWTLTTGSQFRPPGPPFQFPALYQTQYLEVLGKGVRPGIGLPVTRTPLETYSAIFWTVELSGLTTPPGQYFETAYIIARDNKFNRAQTARFVALTAIAQADAAITAWDAKYFYFHWRPQSAIVNNSNATLPTVASWIPLLEVTPPFPEYVSGHSTFGGAVTRMWQNYFGTDSFRFTVKSDSLPGVNAVYNSFSQMATENGYSRVYGGVHFRKSCFDGIEAGIQIADWVYQRFLRPL